jgi:hypothetical protein
VEEEKKEAQEPAGKPHPEKPPRPDLNKDAGKDITFRDGW